MLMHGWRLVYLNDRFGCTDCDKANNTYIIEITILFLGLTGKPITS